MSFDFMCDASHPPELKRYEEAFANDIVHLGHLRDLKFAWKRQQQRAALLLPPCEPDSYDLEDIFKRYYRSVWGGWHNEQHLFPRSKEFDPNKQEEMDFLANCLLLQWKMEDEKLNFDKAPIIVHTKPPGNNSQRTYGPSLQACILGLDPAQLKKVTFEAEIKLQGSSVNQHTLVLMEKQNATPRYQKCPFVVDGNLAGQFTAFQLNTSPESGTNELQQQQQAQPPTAPAKKRKTRETANIESNEELVRQKVRRLVIDCEWCTSWIPGQVVNSLYRREMRGCRDQHSEECDQDDHICLQHCIKANFFQLGVSRINEKNKQQHQDLLSYIEVTVTMYFVNGVVKQIQERTNPFIVAPGKEQTKDSDLFLEFAWRILTGHLVEADCTDQSLTKWKANDDLIKKTGVRWKELREFLKVLFRARNPYVRELDKSELLLIQCKLFMQMNYTSIPGIEQLYSRDPGADIERIKRLRIHFVKDFVNDDVKITLDNLRDEKEKLSIVDDTTQIQQSVWTYLTKVFAVISNGRSNGPIGRSEVSDKFQKKMLDLFNERFITMISLSQAKFIHGRLARNLANQLKKGTADNNSKGRFIMLFFDDDNADVCCAIYSNVDDFTKDPLQSHTPFREILNTPGGFWNFMKFPFSLKFHRIIQVKASEPSNKPTLSPLYEETWRGGYMNQSAMPMVNQQMDNNPMMVNDRMMRFQQIPTVQGVPTVPGIPQQSWYGYHTEVPTVPNIPTVSSTHLDPRQMPPGPCHSAPVYPQQQQAQHHHHQQQSNLPHDPYESVGLTDFSRPYSCQPARCSSSVSDATMSVKSSEPMIKMESIELYGFRYPRIRDIFGPLDKDSEAEVFASAGENEVHAKTGQPRQTRDITDAQTLEGVFDLCSINGAQ